MIYAIIGIPLTLSVLADIGQILATIINKMIDQYKLVLLPLLHKHRIFAQKSRKDDTDEEKLEKDEKEEDDDDEDEDESGMLGNIKTAVVSLLILTAVLSLGAYFFSSCQDLTFFDGLQKFTSNHIGTNINSRFYFCFISLTTIGFGDIVPDLDRGSVFCSASSRVVS